MFIHMTNVRYVLKIVISFCSLGLIKVYSEFFFQKIWAVFTHMNSNVYLSSFVDEDCYVLKIRLILNNFNKAEFEFLYRVYTQE